jgi:hypothetical protein
MIFLFNTIYILILHFLIYVHTLISDFLMDT